MEPAIVCAMLMGADAFAQAQDTVDAGQVGDTGA